MELYVLAVLKVALPAQMKINASTATTAISLFRVDLCKATLEMDTDQCHAWLVLALVNLAREVLTIVNLVLLASHYQEISV